MRVLLTGGSGQVGTEVRRRAAGIDLLSPDREAFDLSRPDLLPAVLERLAPQMILSVGAYTAVDRAEEEPDTAFAINRDAVAVLAAYAQSRQIPLVQVSTDYVFDGSLGRPYREDDPPSPAGVYGASKLAGEQAAGKADRHLIVRVGWVFAAHGRNFVRTMLRLAAERDTLRVVEDQTGGPTWAGHIAEGLIATVRRAQRGDSLAHGLHHYGGHPHLSWHGFTAAILDGALARGLIRRRPRLEAITTADYPTPARRPADSRLDSRSPLTRHGWPDPDWRQGLDAVLDELAAG